jgi:putative spermidine/putrescine transport system substrate-binding protein
MHPHSVSRRRFLWLSLVAGTATFTANCTSNNTQTQSADLTQMTWEEITALAKGTTVNWAMWGGSDKINAYADQWIAEWLQKNYEITLNRVPLTDTVEAVNKVLGEVQAGLKSGGTIDLIWINGENFRTMKQGDLLFGPFTDKLPATQYYDLNNAAVTSDFGLPIDGYEAPYTGSYYIMARDSAKVNRAPTNYQELLDWAKANPGRFAYVAPPAFDGSRFLLTTLYATTGGYQQYAGATFDEALWNQKSGQAFDYLKALEPYLWRKGETYPPTQTRLSELFANGEIWMMPAFISTIAEGLATQRLPATTKPFTIPKVSLNDPSFTAIPVNASNPAGGMILANLLASPEGQLQKFKPQVWGDPPLIDVTKLSPQLQQQFTEVEESYGIALQTLAADTVPVVNAEYTTRLEQGWEEQIGRA